MITLHLNDGRVFVTDEPPQSSSNVGPAVVHYKRRGEPRRYFARRYLSHDYDETLVLPIIKARRQTLNDKYGTA